jgi:hypothetical protein
MKRVITAFITATLLVIVAGCGQSNFTQQVDAASIEQALATAGLQVCNRGDVAWNTTPGFVQGKYYVLNTDCTANNQLNPNTTVVVAQFNSAESRDAAQQRFETQYLRHPSAGVVWALGPYIINVDGNLKDLTTQKVKQALVTLHAQ